MTDQEVLKLLREIDRGYKPTEAEKEELAGIEKITWKKIEKIPDCIDILNGLRELDISGDIVKESNLMDIPESIGNLTSLQSLDLSSTQLSTLPESIGKLTRLQRLDLRFTQLNTLPASIENLTSLTDLDLIGAQLSTLPESIGKLTSLQNLTLLGTRLSTLPESIGKLTRLRRLSLGNTQLSTLPESIGNLTSLQILKLSSTKLRTLPESIGNLTNLKYLYLERLTLAELPESLLHLNLEYKTDEFGFRNDGFGIYIHGLKLQNQPIEIFGQSRDLIIEYYESIRKSTSPINECKVVFLGDGGVGKSLAIYRLLNNGKKVSEFRSDGKRETVWGKIRKIINPSVSEFDGEATPGIAISTEKSTIRGEEIRINYWDFGGQEILHSMHRMFLTQRTIYVVLVNARDNTQDERARYWVNNIKSFANGAPILIVINQMDQNPSASINEKSLRAFYPNILPKVIKMSALKDSPESFNQQLRDEIYKGIDGMDSVHSIIPKTWKDLMDIVRGMTGNYMMMDKFEALCVENDVQNYKKYQGDLIDWFQDIGVSFCYRKDRSLEDYMLLEPKWIVNAIYTILFNGRQVSQNGILSKNDLFAILKDDTITVRGTRQQIKRVLPNLRYKGIEVTYVLGVIKRFKLAYELNDESLFIPMLCDRDERISVKDSVGEDSRHIIIKYEYLPENVIHRVIVDMRQDLDYENVWFSGAVFCNRHGSKAYDRLSES